MLLALSSSVALRYQTEIYGADTNSLFMGGDRDQHEYVQKVTSAVQIYRLIIRAKSKVKREPILRLHLIPGNQQNICFCLRPLRLQKRLPGVSVVCTYFGCEQTSVWAFLPVCARSGAHSTVGTHGNLSIYQHFLRDMSANAN